MSIPLLNTKLYIPPVRPELVSRPRLVERLNAGLGRSGGFARKLTLIAAPAGSGKTTLLSEWINQSPVPNTQYPIPTSLGQPSPASLALAGSARRERCPVEHLQACLTTRPKSGKIFTKVLLQFLVASTDAYVLT
jgi:hypothetical protein